MPRKTDKRERLVQAAMALIHQQGYISTTLADIALKADVPLGNVYYYFKTKEAIGVAVIDFRAIELHERLNYYDTLTDPSSRLFELVQYEVDQASTTSHFGCPIGGLCQELAKQGGALAEAAGKLLSDTLGWVERQFRTLGVSQEQCKSKSLELISMMQGFALLTVTFKDAKLLSLMAEIIRKQINMLVERKGVPA